MKVLTTFIDNTGAPITDTIEKPDENNVLQRFKLSGAVSGVRFMAQNETGAVTVDNPATIEETVDPATYGDVSYTPQSGDVDAEQTYIAWWRLTLSSGAVLDTPEFLWVIEPHGIAATSIVQPSGVCAAWATNADIARYTPLAEEADFTSWLVEASEILYVLSARQYPGICTQTVRPQRSTCGCWQVLSRGHIVTPVNWDWVGGYWQAESDSFQGWGCGSLRAVRLSGYVNAITDVRIGGVIVDPTTYRVDLNEWLIRLTDPTTGQNPGWPACQDMSLPNGAPGTFDITYTWGRTPPIAGVRAAATLAWQLYLNDNPTGKAKCKLPAGWTSITRQGITITRPQIQKLSTEGTGLVGIDAFLGSANPNGLDRPPAVYSRDVMPYAQRVGS